MNALATCHFGVCCNGKLSQGEQVEVRSLSETIVDRLLCTKGSRQSRRRWTLWVGPYFERILLSPSTRLASIWVSSVVISCGTTASMYGDRSLRRGGEGTPKRCRRETTDDGSSVWSLAKAWDGESVSVNVVFTASRRMILSLSELDEFTPSFRGTRSVSGCVVTPDSATCLDEYIKTGHSKWPPRPHEKYVDFTVEPRLVTYVAL